MLNEVASIVESFDTLGMSPDEIALDRGLDIVAVKAALAQSSKKYRSVLASAGASEEEKDPTLDFTNDDLRDANDAIVRLMKHGEDEGLRLKAAIYVRDDKKGRKEIVKAIGGNQFNLFQFNDALRSAKAGAAALKQGALDIVTQTTQAA